MSKKTEGQLREYALNMAVGHYLSDFPDDMEPAEILSLLLECDERVVVWEPFEFWEPESVVNAIEQSADAFYNDLKRAQEGAYDMKTDQESVYLQAQRLHKEVVSIDRDSLYEDWSVSALIDLVDELNTMVGRLVLAHATGERA